MTICVDGQKTVLGLDLGTSSVKLSLFDEVGHLIASASEDYPMYGRENSMYEQNPIDWISAIETCIRKIGSRLSADADDPLNDTALTKLVSIGLSAQMPTLVAVDRRSGEPARNAILWCDARAEGQAETLLRTWGEERHYQITGVILDGRYIIPMAKWLIENDEDVRRLAESGNLLLLSAKDYLLFRLVGEAITDPSTASGFGVYDIMAGSWDGNLLAEAGIDISWLPKIEPGNRAVAKLCDAVRRHLRLNDGIQVVNGGADSVCGLLGSGLFSAGSVCQIWGSSTAILALTDKPTIPKDGLRKSADCKGGSYFITPTTDSGVFAYEADILATGTAVKWLSGILTDGDIPELIRLAERSPAGSKGLTFYPYISGGEQGVLWDPLLCGGIRGLTEERGGSDIVRALLEALCFETRRCLEVFKGDGFVMKRIVCTGHLPSNPFFAKMLSDILGSSIEVGADENSSALGAAVVAAASVGLWNDDIIKEITDAKTSVYESDAEVHRNYEQYYRNYIENTQSMRCLHDRFG